MSNNELVIIPKIEKYIEYMLTILIRLPRIEKFSIGTEINFFDMLKVDQKINWLQLKNGKITLPEIQRSIAGWTGYVKHADTFNLMKSMFYIEG